MISQQMEPGKVINRVTKFVQERVPFPLGEQIHKFVPGDQVWVKDWKHDSLEPHPYMTTGKATVFSQFSSVQLLSHVRLFATPWTAALPGLPIHHQLPGCTQTHVY